jgi:hypothetical protein
MVPTGKLGTACTVDFANSRMEKFHERFESTPFAFATGTAGNKVIEFDK